MSEFDFLNIPDSAVIGKTVFKKLFYENAELSKTDVNRIKNNIDRIDWLYSLSPDTVNVLPYQDDIREYSEIEVLLVELRKSSDIKRIAEIIMRAIPYPMLLIFRYENKILYGVSHQRNSLTNISQNVIEELIITDFVNKEEKIVDFKQYSYNNFYAMYCDLLDSIILYNASHHFKIEKMDAAQAKYKLERLQMYESEIEKLEMRIKKETQFNRKMELNIELVQTKQKLNQLLNDCEQEEK